MDDLEVVQLGDPGKELLAEPAPQIARRGVPDRQQKLLRGTATARGERTVAAVHDEVDQPVLGLEAVREDKVPVSVGPGVAVDIELLHRLLLGLVHPLHRHQLALVPALEHSARRATSQRPLGVHHQRIAARDPDQHLGLVVALCRGALAAGEGDR